MTSVIETISGNAWKFGDRCDTGQIIPGKYVPLTDPEELAKHLFEEIRPGFLDKLAPGDIVVAGLNFGCGSSREHAPKSLKYAGVSAVVADSFARIFFRNALNIGLFAVPVPGISQKVNEGDTLTIHLKEGRLINVSTGKEYHFTPYEEFIMEMVEAGGILKHTLKCMNLEP